MISGLARRRDVIRFFLDRGVRHTVFKMGADGSSIAWRGENGGSRRSAFPPLPLTVVDSTGCGDAYCAGFIVGLLARLGSRASAPDSGPPRLGS